MRKTKKKETRGRKADKLKDLATIILREHHFSYDEIGYIMGGIDRAAMRRRHKRALLSQ